MAAVEAAPAAEPVASDAAMKDVELGGAPLDGTAPAFSSHTMAAGGSYTLEAKDLSYTVKIKEGKEMKDKTIVHPVNFVIKPKQLLAIMGASGAGKSTLLDILATRIPRSATDGEYLLNGAPVAANFKRLSGYVMQDDALYPLLTVRETLQYAALLRIPNLSRKDKWEVVEDTIRALKLTACADTICGDDRHRGVSGGEKRRVSIGVDIVHQPSIIFLDEPTSGLDSTTALQIVDTLKDICSRDRTIAVTIHQPSSRVFEVFDKVMFMSKGHLVYNGPPSALATHMTPLSKDPLPQFANLSELFLEIVDSYEKSGTVEQLVEHRKEIEKARQRSVSNLEPESTHHEPQHFANNFFAETSILLHRNFVNVLRTPELFFVRIALCCVIGLVLGSVFWNIPGGDEGIGQLAGYSAFVEAFFIFTSLEALPIFLNERSVFAREQGRGAYRLSSFVMANSVVMLPFFFAMALVFTSISFFMVGLSSDNANFIFQVILIFTVLTAGNGFATFVSGIVPDALTGNSAGTAVLAFMFLFSGFFIPASQIPRGWIWLNYISMFRYPFEGLMKSNLDLLPASEADLRQQYLDDYSIDGWNRWGSVGVMLTFTVGWRALFYVALRLKYGSKR
ncbi:P-loop containing nucleoside triphosphate hydrolase protein [Tribonema minus]|uniref:P-loop containing nucleoside triphosphate hydrolase protein n=1 Tax=Tribonema minus TaxID=303371 RepID=A0A835ZIY6_9STRA|nr:P-loop containing nucleoside triphosphate hydrolase protein [Tribonema minus]